MKLAEVKPEQRAYRPFGAAEQVMYSKDEEVLLSGPAGTGKSRAILEKLHLICMKYPGARCLFVRKTRSSLTESGLVTFEEKVVPLGSRLVLGPQRRMRQAYHYDNTSELVIGGLDDPTKIMSTEYDIIYVQEAIEATEGDWESMITRLRNGVVPYQQIMADTNPDTPTHWLYMRCKRGLTKLIECRHEDNPTLYDHKNKVWTPNGTSYIAKLERLSGPRYQRLRHGKWVSAEGMIYDEWDNLLHMVDRFDIPAGWTRFWAVDFGFTNPFVCQWWAQDPDGRLIRYREIYKTGVLVEDHAKVMLEQSGWKWNEKAGKHEKVREDAEPLPRAIVTDHDAEGRATLERHLGMPTTAAHKAVTEGIQAAQARLKKAGDEKPRVEFMRDSLVERDQTLDDAKKPCCTEEEIPGYVWDLKAGQKKGDCPVKEDDHGADTFRYMVAHVDITGANAAAGGVPDNYEQDESGSGVWDEAGWR